MEKNFSKILKTVLICGLSVSLQSLQNYYQWSWKGPQEVSWPTSVSNSKSNYISALLADVCLARFDLHQTFTDGDALLLL